MTLVPDPTAFPQNVVKMIAERAPGFIDADLAVFKRPLRNTDPNQSFGVFGSLWQPNESSYEIRGGPQGPNEPTLQRYVIGVQAFVKDMDEERGLDTHGAFAQRVRAMLYRDDVLRVMLRSLNSTASDVQERLHRWGIGNQRLLSNELDGSWLYLSTLEFWLETETH